MAIVCENHKLIFIMAPRTGCTATGQLLCQEYGGKFIPENDIINSEGYFLVQRKHCTLSDLVDNKLISPDDLDLYLKFTTVRNPFDSLLSLYTKKRVAYKSLINDPQSWVYKVPGYVEDIRFCQKYSFNVWVLKNLARKFIKKIFFFKESSLSDDFTKGMDLVLKFENLQSDFENALNKAKINAEIIPEVNTTTARPKNYRQSYNYLSRKLVEFVYADEMKKYNYRF